MKTIINRNNFIRQILSMVLAATVLISFSLVIEIGAGEYICLRRAKNSITRPWLSVGAQRVITGQGAHTGRLFVGTARTKGASYALVYHSETRQDYTSEAARALEKKGVTPEGDVLNQAVYEIINSEVKSILSNGMTPVICVGEDIKIRQAGLTINVVKGQAERALADLTAEQVSKVVIAYEPIWAIGGSGSGIAATPEVAQEVHAAIRDAIRERFGDAAARSVRILYGGSVNESNIQGFLVQPDIDGALVGGASAKLESFSQIVRIAQEQVPKDGRMPVIMGNWKTYPVTPAVNPFIRGLFLHTYDQRNFAEVVIFPQDAEIPGMVSLISELDEN